MNENEDISLINYEINDKENKDNKNKRRSNLDKDKEKEKINKGIKINEFNLPNEKKKIKNSWFSIINNNHENNMDFSIISNKQILLNNSSKLIKNTLKKKLNRKNHSVYLENNKIKEKINEAEKNIEENFKINNRDINNNIINSIIDEKEFNDINNLSITKIKKMNTNRNKSFNTYFKSKTSNLEILKFIKKSETKSYIKNEENIQNVNIEYDNSEENHESNSSLEKKSYYNINQKSKIKNYENSNNPNVTLDQKIINNTIIEENKNNISNDINIKKNNNLDRNLEFKKQISNRNILKIESNINNELAKKEFFEIKKNILSKHLNDDIHENKFSNSSFTTIRNLEKKDLSDKINFDKQIKNEEYDNKKNEGKNQCILKNNNIKENSSGNNQDSITNKFNKENYISSDKTKGSGKNSIVNFIPTGKADKNYQKINTNTSFPEDIIKIKNDIKKYKLNEINISNQINNRSDDFLQIYNSTVKTTLSAFFYFCDYMYDNSESQLIIFEIIKCLINIISNFKLNDELKEILIRFYQKFLTKFKIKKFQDLSIIITFFIKIHFDPGLSFIKKMVLECILLNIDKKLFEENLDSILEITEMIVLPYEYDRERIFVFLKFVKQIYLMISTNKNDCNSLEKLKIFIIKVMKKNMPVIEEDMNNKLMKIISKIEFLQKKENDEDQNYILININF